MPPPQGQEAPFFGKATGWACNQVLLIRQAALVKGFRSSPGDRMARSDGRRCAIQAEKACVPLVHPLILAFGGRPSPRISAGTQAALDLHNGIQNHLSHGPATPLGSGCAATCSRVPSHASVAFSFKSANDTLGTAHSEGAAKNGSPEPAPSCISGDTLARPWQASLDGGTLNTSPPPRQLRAGRSYSNYF